LRAIHDSPCNSYLSLHAISGSSESHRLGRVWNLRVDTGRYRYIMAFMPDPAELLKQVSELSQRAASLLEEGRIEESTEAQLAADRALRRAKRAMAGRSAEALGRERRATTSPTDREVMVSALAELSVPSSPKLVSSYALARFGAQLRPNSFASLRR